MTEMTIHIEGLEELRRRFGNSAILSTELKTAARAGLTDIRDHAKYNAALLANKFSDFRKSLALTVDHGRTFLATADRAKIMQWIMTQY